MNPRVLPRSLVTLAFPLLIAIAYTNVSDVLLRTFGIPSILQATVLVLAVVVILDRKELRPLEVIRHPVTIAMVVFCAMLFVS
ncbi:MAG TPA: hypothetical protein VF219_13215, partial [Vicinamibacterales bacterium]